MSGSAQRWVLRLSTEGADQVVRDLRAAATESAAAARAYDALVKAQPQLATGAERAEQALRKNTDAVRSMRGEYSAASIAIDGATASLGRFGSALTSPAAAIAALSAGMGAGVVQIARLGDEYTTTMNKLRAATGSLGAASQVYGELVALSQQTGASISESAGAFVRFSVAARSIGATNGEVLQLTRTIQQAGLISGASTQEAAAGVQQLGQALASGTLQGDELRSILENMPVLAEALAGQLGVSIGQLRQMGSEGQSRPSPTSRPKSAASTAMASSQRRGGFPPIGSDGRRAPTSIARSTSSMRGWVAPLSRWCPSRAGFRPNRFLRPLGIRPAGPGLPPVTRSSPRTGSPSGTRMMMMVTRRRSSLSRMMPPISGSLRVTRPRRGATANSHVVVAGALSTTSHSRMLHPGCSR